MKVSQAGVRQSVRGLMGFRTSALGNRFRCEQGFHQGIEYRVAWLSGRRSANQQNHNDDDEQEAD